MTSLRQIDDFTKGWRFRRGVPDAQALVTGNGSLPTPHEPREIKRLLSGEYSVG